jgi:hypothetical protein
MEGPGRGVESPAVRTRTGGGAVYPDRTSIIERISRHSLQIRAEIITNVSIDVGFGRHSSKKVIGGFACCCRELVFVLYFVVLYLGTYSTKIGS